MALALQFQGGPQAGKVLQFGDDVERVTIGRDPKCSVPLPAEESHVGHEHCALRRELGRYRLVLNRDDVVLLDGKQAVDGQELSPKAKLQLGRHGPTLVVETISQSSVIPTLHEGKNPGVPTRVQEAADRAARSKKIALTSALVLLIAGFVAYRAVVDRNEETVALVNERSKALEGLAAKYADINSAVKSLAPELRDVLNRAAPSVYLVLKEDAKGRLFSSATAWVVDHDKKILATNGHVAADFQTLAPGEKLLVRSPGAQAHDFVVKDIRIHPGYDESNQLWARYQPVIRTGAGDVEPVSPAGSSCDVALLFVEGTDDLAPQLPMADDKVLATVGPGYPVGYVGYEMESLALDGVNQGHPTAATQVANIVSMTDCFGSTACDFSDRILIQHALPEAGGASGSPILNQDGVVVAVNNGGNFIKVNSPDGTQPRVATGAGINYGQRVDLLGELLNGTADERQVARLKSWEQQIAKFQKRSDVLPDSIIAANFESLRQSWSDLYAAHGAFQVTTKKLGRDDGTLAGDDNALQTYEHEFDIADPGTSPGHYLLAVVTETSNALTLVAAFDDGKTTYTYQGQGNVDRSKYVAFSQPAAGKLTVTVSSKAPCHVAIELIQATAVPVTTDNRRAAVVAAWLHDVQESSDLPRKATLVVNPKLTLAAKDDKSPGGIVGYVQSSLAVGRYLVIAIPPDDSDFNLVILNGDDSKAPAVAVDNSNDPWAHCSFDLSAPTSIDSFVLGPKVGTAVDLYVYRAD